ncbi:MAG: GspH/FimT family pseudopilin [Candidatus Binatia bacterium]
MQHHRGFTLLEALIGVALAGVLAAISVPRLGEWRAVLALEGTAQELSTALRLARGQALSGGETVEVRFDSGAGRWETYTRAGRIGAAQALPPRVAFAGLPARSAVRFAGTGTADNATVTLAAGTHVAQIIVNQRGRVRAR